MDMQSAARQLAPKINRYIDENRQIIIDDLQRILRFQTVSGGKTPEEQQLWRDEIHNGFTWLGQKGEAAGLAYKNIEDTACYLEQASSGETLGLLLHLDVVPPGEGWTHPPFAAEIADDIVFGRGCQDDKGPIIQSLHGLLAAKSLGLPFRRRVRLIVGSEEETGLWADMKRYLEVEAPPAFSIVPDGAFPIVNGEKGMVDIRISTDAPGAESGTVQLLSVTSGFRSNVVPPLAEIALRCPAENEAALRRQLADFLAAESKVKAEINAENGVLTIVFHGKNAHGSMPGEGQNAARDALRFLAQLPLAGPRADFVHLLAALVADDEGAALGIANTHHFIGSTTQSLGILRIDDACEAIINIRHTPPQTTPVILAQIEQTARAQGSPIADWRVKFHGKKHEPLYVDPRQYPEHFAALEAAYGTMTGRQPRCLAMGGTTFAKAFPHAMCFGPTDTVEEEELAHQSDERICIEHHLRNTRIYGLAIALLALDISALL